jgi:ribonuclease HI
MEFLNEFDIYTDGSYHRNSDSGGWSAVIISGGKKLELLGGEEKTSSERMEMISVVEALSFLKKRTKVRIFTDSASIVDAFEKKHLERWRKNGWRNRKNKLVPNRDLWKKIHALCNYHRVEFFHVRGHSGDEFNERCDRAARSMIRR